MELNRRDFVKTSGIATLGVGEIPDIVSPQQTSPGEVLWTFEAGDEVNSSPTVVDGTVYVGSSDTHVYAVDAVSGEKEWGFETGRWIVSAPNVVDGTVYVGSGDSNIYALDAEGRYEIWRFETDGSVFSSPTVADGTVYVGSEAPDSHLYALDAATGDEVWSFDTGEDIDTSPTVAGGTVFIGTNAIRAGRVYAVDAASGEIIWRSETARRWHSPTVVNDTLFVGTGSGNGGSLYAFDASTGEQIWQFELPDAESVSSMSPTVADTRVYVGGHRGTVYAVDTATGEEVWRFETGNEVQSSPTVADDTLYVGSDTGYLYALDAGTGDEIWRVEVGPGPAWGVESSPTVVDGTVYVGSQDSHVYAVDAGVGEGSEGSRVSLGTLGHHHAWADQEIQFPDFYYVTIEGTDAPVLQGADLDVEMRVENTGDKQGTQTLELTDFDGTVVDSEEITLAAGEGVGVTLVWGTEAGDADDGEITVVSDDTTATQTVAVQTQEDIGVFEVVAFEPQSAATIGAEIEVEATVENTGGDETTQQVVYVFEGEAVGAEGVTLGPGDSTTLEFTHTVPDAEGEYEHGVETENDETDATITLVTREEDSDPTRDADTTDDDGADDDSPTEGNDTTEELADTDPGKADDTPGGAGPGFGVGGTLTGIAGAGYMLKRRLSDDDTSSE